MIIIIRTLYTKTSKNGQLRLLLFLFPKCGSGRILRRNMRYQRVDHTPSLIIFLQCALSQSSKFVYGRMCSGDELIDIKNLGTVFLSLAFENLSYSGRMTRAGYLARGVERLLFSLDAVYRKLCPQQVSPSIWR